MESVQVQKETELNQTQTGVQASIFNTTQNAMTLSRSISWAGTPGQTGFPKTIPANKPDLFMHKSDGKTGSSAAVVYTGVNNTKQPCAWVLAWYAPDGTDHNTDKVYVTCGLKADIDKMTFDGIRSELNKSKRDSVKEDRVSKAKASAHITGVVPSSAAVGSSFGLMP